MPFAMIRMYGTQSKAKRQAALSGWKLCPFRRQSLAPRLFGTRRQDGPDTARDGLTRKGRLSQKADLRPVRADNIAVEANFGDTRAIMPFEFRTGAQATIVIEKDAVFRPPNVNRHLDRVPYFLVMVMAKSMPDIATR